MKCKKGKLKASTLIVMTNSLQAISVTGPQILLPEEDYDLNMVDDKDPVVDEPETSLHSPLLFMPYH
jgi:hypothetical protein